MAHRRYTWFIDTKGDPGTNRLASQNLGEEDECRGQLCEDGKSRDLWRCPSREFVHNFQRTADVNKYSYNIYVREGDHGLIHLWPFGVSRKSHVANRNKMSLKHIIAEAVMLSGI
jgi:hypothetical protein